MGVRARIHVLELRHLEQAFPCSAPKKEVALRSLGDMVASKRACTGMLPHITSADTLGACLSQNVVALKSLLFRYLPEESFNHSLDWRRRAVCIPEHGVIVSGYSWVVL